MTYKEHKKLHAEWAAAYTVAYKNLPKAPEAPTMVLGDTRSEINATGTLTISDRRESVLLNQEDAIALAKWIG